MRRLSLLSILALLTLTLGCGGPSKTRVERAVCGDGFFDPAWGEECDDGNLLDGDGCSAACVMELCGDLLLHAELDEECDDGPHGSEACTDRCDVRSCGNGVFEPERGEECDFGYLGGAGCTSQCRAEPCGDGVLDLAAGEQCDDGNYQSADGCSSDCILEEVTAQVTMFSCETWGGAEPVAVLHHVALSPPPSPDCSPELVTVSVASTISIPAELLETLAERLVLEGAPPTSTLLITFVRHTWWVEDAPGVFERKETTLEPLPLELELADAPIDLRTTTAGHPVIVEHEALVVPWTTEHIVIQYAHPTFDLAINVVCRPDPADDAVPVAIAACDQCPDGEQLCGYEGQSACVGSSFCDEGCCQPFVIP